MKHSLKKKIVKMDINQIDGGDYGIQFPWLSIIFLIVGLASEVTDSLLLIDVLSPILSELGETLVKVISFITGAVCFFSMAAIGYQSANSKVKYKTKVIEIIIWLLVGFYLVWLRINNALFNWEGISEFMSNKDVVMGGLAILLYVGTGFMTYSSTKQLTNSKLYEYVLAKREYEKLMEELINLREEITVGISDLNNYPKYCSRLVKSKKSLKNNLLLNNKAVKSLIEAKMSLMVEPDIMDDIYNDSTAKIKKEFESI